MGLYDNWQLANSTKTKDFAGTMAPELKEVKASAEDRYYKAQDLMLGTQEKLGTAEVLPQDQAAWEQISNEATGKINEWATRGDLENALPDLYRTASKAGVKMVALANNTKKREQIKKDLDDREKYGYLNPATKDYILGKADENFKGTTFDEYNRPVNSYGYSVKPTKQVDNIARAKRALEGLVPEGDSTITTEVGRAEAAANMLESVKTGNGWKGLSKERIQQALAAAIESDPEWKASIDQDARTSTYQNNITEEMAQKVIADPASQVGQAALKLVKENNYSAKEAVEEVNTVLHRNDTYRSLGTFADAASYFDITHSEQITDRGIPKEGPTGPTTPGGWIPSSQGLTLNLPDEHVAYKDYVTKENEINARIADLNKKLDPANTAVNERERAVAQEDLANATAELNMNRFKKTDFQNQRQVQYEDATIEEPTAVKTEVKDGKKVTRHIDWQEVKKDNRELQRKTFDDLENAVVSSNGGPSLPSAIVSLPLAVTSGANSKKYKLTGTGVHIGAMTPVVMNELQTLSTKDRNSVFNAIIDKKSTTDLPIKSTREAEKVTALTPGMGAVSSYLKVKRLAKEGMMASEQMVTLNTADGPKTISKNLYETLTTVARSSETPVYKKVVEKVEKMPTPSIRASNYTLTGEKYKDVRDAIVSFANTEQLIDPTTMKAVAPAQVNAALEDPKLVTVTGYIPELNYGTIRTPQGQFFVDLNSSNTRKRVAQLLDASSDQDLRVMSDILAPSRDPSTGDHEGANLYPQYLNKLRSSFDFIPITRGDNTPFTTENGNAVSLLQHPKHGTYTIYQTLPNGKKEALHSGLSLNAAISYYHYAQRN